MAKIKQHPIYKNCFMYWDIATDELNCFFVREVHPNWSWNENYENPTVSPSILNEHEGFRNHVFIHDGQIQYLSDCTHKYAGKTVDMVEFPDDVY